MRQSDKINEAVDCRSLVSSVAEAGRCVVREVEACRNRKNGLVIKEFNWKLGEMVLLLLSHRFPI